MTNNADDLDALWQQQSVSQVNADKLKKQWKTLRLKQYFYFLMDILSVLALPVVIILVPKKLNTFEFVWLSSVFALLFVMFLYLVYLRRYSLGFKADTANTHDFVQRFRLQYQQNIRISRLNKLLCFITPLIFLTYVVIAYFGEYVQVDVLMRKTKILMGMSVVCMPLCWIWAHKREQKYKRRLADFEAQWDVTTNAMN